MLPRQRVYSSLEFNKPDKVPLEYGLTLRGFYEHGEKLKLLFSRHSGDFGDNGDCVNISVPLLDKNLSSIGEYHEFIEDEWGTLWEHRIYLMHGQPVKWPLDNIDDIYRYKLPPQPLQYVNSKNFNEFKNNIERHKEKYFYKDGWVGIFEKMIALRKFEDVLVDIAMDSAEINMLADKIEAYHLKNILRLIEAGVDAVQFGDDYGMQTNMMMSPDLWKKFFKPRLSRLIQPVKCAGRKVFFHSCGLIKEIIDDLKEIGVDAIWPQLALYDMKELAEHCKSIKLAVAIHIDRANIMTHGNTKDVKIAVDTAFEVFRPDLGGSWFYIEVDNGFPFENIEALVTSITKYR